MHGVISEVAKFVLRMLPVVLFVASPESRLAGFDGEQQLPLKHEM